MVGHIVTQMKDKFLQEANSAGYSVSGEVTLKLQRVGPRELALRGVEGKVEDCVHIGGG